MAIENGIWKKIKVNYAIGLSFHTGGPTNQFRKFSKQPGLQVLFVFVKR